MGHDTEPRLQHYLFAHRALPSVAFGQPARMLEVLLGEESQLMLLNLWDQAGVQSPPSQHVPPRGLACTLHQLDPLRLLAVVQLPPAEADTEAHFVGLVFETTQPNWAGPSTPKSVRCFTLERGTDFASNAPRTVLCEWTGDGTHINMGSGPDASVEQFVQAVRAHIPSHAA